jgi:hypothetical protein
VPILVLHARKSRLRRRQDKRSVSSHATSLTTSPLTSIATRCDITDHECLNHSHYLHESDPVTPSKTITITIRDTPPLEGPGSSSLSGPPTSPLTGPPTSASTSAFAKRGAKQTGGVKRKAATKRGPKRTAKKTTKTAPNPPEDPPTEEDGEDAHQAVLDI